MTQNKRTPFKEVVTNLITWNVELGADGQFYANAKDMPEVSSSTFDGVEAICKRHAAKHKVKVSVPYMRFARKGRETFVVVHGIATGFHASNGRVLVREGERLSDGEIVYHTAEAIQSYSHDVFPPLDEGDAKRVIEVNNQLLELQRERNAILARYTWRRGFGGTVSDAVDEAVRAKNSE